MIKVHFWRKVVLASMLTGIAVLITACDSDTPQISGAEKTAATKAVRAVKGHYKRLPIGGGWRITSISQSRGNVDVNILIPDHEASGIMSEKPGMQFAAISLACPSKRSKAWTLLGNRHTIILHAGGSGGAFIEVDCRRWGS